MAEQQIGLDALGIQIVSDKALNLIKKVAKITGKPQSDYTNMDEEELDKLLEELKVKQKLTKKMMELDSTKTEEACMAMDVDVLRDLVDETKMLIDKKAKLIKNLASMSLTYDEEKTMEENEQRYQTALDHKNNPVYTYPFRIYFKGHDIQQPDHIFNEGQQYTEKEIGQALFKHGYKEFAGNAKFAYDSEDNMLVPEFKSQRHG